MRRSRLIALGATALGALIALLASTYLLSSPDDRGRRTSSEPELNSEDGLPLGVSAADYASAKLAFEQAYRKNADRDDVLSWLGEASFDKSRWDTALACFEQIPPDVPRYGRISCLYRGRTLMHLHRAQRAEESLNQFLLLETESPQSKPEHVAEALLQLQYLLGLELRFEERKRVLGSLIQLGVVDRESVLNYCFPTLHRWNGSLAAAALEKFWREDPQDPRLRVALGRYRTGQGRVDDALSILEPCRREFPNSVSTAAALMACLHEQAAWKEIGDILTSLPAANSNQPWLLSRMRGHFHNQQEEFAEGAKCFQMVIDANPADAEGWMGLGTAQAGLNDTTKHQLCLKTSLKLSRIQNRIGWAIDQPDDVSALQEIAEIAEGIGLAKEASLVVQCGLKEHPQHQELLALRERLQSKVNQQ